MSTATNDQDAAKAIFREIITLLEAEGVPYAAGGSLATHHWIGSGAPIGDIDLIIREDDAPRILKLLEQNGYETSEMAHSWLHKGFKDSVTVDLIYRLKNEATLDEEFLDHRSRVDVLGVMAYVASAEDQIAALIATVDRQTIGDHWYDLLDVMSNNDLDWDYLAKRCEGFPLRVLSVFYFGLGEQVPIQRTILERMHKLVEDLPAGISS